MKFIFTLVTLALSGLFFATVAHAFSPPVSLITASGSAVYYLAQDGKRYVFPNEKTYRTWYNDFSEVQVVSDEMLASLPLGGNVTYRPATRLVKITTDPKVYAVDRGGALRWITNESVAIALYGAEWSKSVDDVPDAFFTNYTEGDAITSVADFNRSIIRSTVANIDIDKGLVDVKELAFDQLHIIEADDVGFYPPSVSATLGKKLRLTFKVRSVGVYFGGLLIKSDHFADQHIGLGQEVSVDVTVPDQNIIFQSFWPTSGVLKATGEVIVE